MKKIITIGFIGLALQACTFDPYVEDWKRNRITEIPTEPITVSVCFDHTKHSKETVYGIAQDECGQRITEVENLVQRAKARGASLQNSADGQAFEGSVQRSKRIQAMVSSLQLKYMNNDKWDCPLMTPNRITFQCVYNENATDSIQKRQSSQPVPVSPDLPPELPDDLKPQ
ncbi:MAG: hypothetical protein HWE30_05880 [Methylocystaceae bacterium]|nr:hypothetical protein [Methylocystaceae bacterium]